MIDRCNPGGQLVSGERRTDEEVMIIILSERKEGRKEGRAEDG